MTARKTVRPLLLVLGLLVTCGSSIRAREKEPLTIYFVDVEGGQATLIVTPERKSMLIDTGYPGHDGRDIGRILATMRQANVERLDYLLITHYHIDHVGNAVELAQRIKIDTFLDHGPNRETNPETQSNYAAYQKAAAAHMHRILKPGGHLTLGDAHIDVVSAAGETITKPLPGGGSNNPLCATEPASVDDPSENAKSVGIVLTYGKFRFVDLGDLTKKKELALACPRNLLGETDLYLTTHHGLDLSNARALVHALRPRVAIMNNGPHKGGKPSAWQIVHNSPALEALWQLHYAADADAAHNTSDPMIANTSENCAGKGLTVSADANGTFTVTNSRNGYSQTYRK